MQEPCVQNAQMLSSNYTNDMLKVHKCCAQNTQMLCSKHTNNMLKIHKRCAQNTQMCSKYTNVLKIHKRAQNTQTCSKYTNVVKYANVLKIHKGNVFAFLWLYTSYSTLCNLQQIVVTSYIVNVVYSKLSQV